MENSNTNLTSENDFIIDVSDLAEVHINYGNQTFTDSHSISSSIPIPQVAINERKIGQKYFKKLSLTENQIEVLDRLSFHEI